MHIKLFKNLEITKLEIYPKCFKNIKIIKLKVHK